VFDEKLLLMTKKNIEPRNNKDQPHGYWEYYHNNGKLWYKCVYYNGKENGFEDYYRNENGKLTSKNYYL